MAATWSAYYPATTESPLVCVRCGVMVLEPEVHDKHHAMLDELAEWAKRVSERFKT